MLFLKYNNKYIFYNKIIYVFFVIYKNIFFKQCFFLKYKILQNDYLKLIIHFFIKINF